MARSPCRKCPARAEQRNNAAAVSSRVPRRPLLPTWTRSRSALVSHESDLRSDRDPRRVHGQRAVDRNHAPRPLHARGQCRLLDRPVVRASGGEEEAADQQYLGRQQQLLGGSDEPRVFPSWRDITPAERVGLFALGVLLLSTIAALAAGIGAGIISLALHAVRHGLWLTPAGAFRGVVGVRSGRLEVGTNETASPATAVAGGARTLVLDGARRASANSTSGASSIGICACWSGC